MNERRGFRVATGNHLNERRHDTFRLLGGDFVLIVQDQADVIIEENRSDFKTKTRRKIKIIQGNDVVDMDKLSTFC